MLDLFVPRWLQATIFVSFMSWFVASAIAEIVKLF
jgi:hypothetical protein